MSILQTRKLRQVVPMSTWLDVCNGATAQMSALCSFLLSKMPWDEASGTGNPQISAGIADRWGWGTQGEAAKGVVSREIRTLQELEVTAAWLCECAECCGTVSFGWRVSCHLDLDRLFGKKKTPKSKQLRISYHPFGKRLVSSWL